MSFSIEYYGTSHGEEVGVKAEGLPKNEKVNLDELSEFMKRRKPTTRDEADAPIIKTGIENNVTTGGLIDIAIKNTDVKSEDYDNLNYVPRPGHADYTAYVKYGDEYDFKGGGQFSGRLTAPLCALGGICIQMLNRRNISISSRVTEMGDVENATLIGDSVGGIIECQIDGVPAGVGGPFTSGLESRLSSALFGIPAVKGVEFGAGFAAASMMGSENNDPFIVEDGKVVTKTNNCGGILGGISTGMPIVFRVAFKPTPSIKLPQNSVNLKTLEETIIEIDGRHDACIVLRALPVVEAAAAIVITEVLQEENKL